MRFGDSVGQVLTRRRGRCPRTPARDSSPLDPRQGGMAPLGTAILAGAVVRQRPWVGRWWLALLGNRWGGLLTGGGREAFVLIENRVGGGAGAGGGF